MIQVHNPEPCSHELDVVHSQVQTHIVGVIDHRREHLNVEGQLVGLVKRVLVVPVGHHAVKDGLLRPVVAVLELDIVRHLTVDAARHAPVQVRHHTAGVGGTQARVPGRMGLYFSGSFTMDWIRMRKVNDIDYYYYDDFPKL